MPHLRNPRFLANVITHALAGVVGGLIAVALGWGQGPPVEDEHEATETCKEPPRHAVAASMPTWVSRCPEPPAYPEPEIPVAEGRTLLLELQKASAESMLAELGAMPMTWAQVPDAPSGLLPEQFGASVDRAAAELGLVAPEVDCSE